MNGSILEVYFFLLMALIHQWYRFVLHHQVKTCYQLNFTNTYQRHCQTYSTSGSQEWCHAFQFKYDRV